MNALIAIVPVELVFYVYCQQIIVAESGNKISAVPDQVKAPRQAKRMRYEVFTRWEVKVRPNWRLIERLLNGPCILRSISTASSPVRDGHGITWNRRLSIRSLRCERARKG